MAVKITQNGIDTVQNNIITSAKVQTNGVSTDDMPSGSYLQVLNTIYTGRPSISITSSDTDIPGCAITITPKGTNSKFLIHVRGWVECDSEWNIMFNIQRNGARINTGGLGSYWSGLGMAVQTYNGASDNSSTPATLNFSTYDTTGSTAGVPITFKLVGSADGTRTMWINRTFASDGQGGQENSTTEMIIIEVKG